LFILPTSAFIFLQVYVMKIGFAGYSGSGVTTMIALLSEDLTLLKKHGGPEIRSIILDDPRLESLGALFHAGKITPVHVEVIELGDLRPEDTGGLKRETLNRATGLDALVLILRGFAAPMSSQCRDENELAGEIKSLMQEFAIADLLPVESRLERLSKEGKTSSREAQLLLRLKEGLEEGHPIRGMELDKEEIRALSGYQFLTLLPLLVIANTGEDGKGKTVYTEITGLCSENRMAYLEIPILQEAELLEIAAEERASFLEELGIREPAKERFFSVLFERMSLITFFTVSEKEVRAWMVPEGTPAARAAGKVHTDMERGFIRAEVISVDECVQLGGLVKAREAGKLRVEGKDYLLKDGEVFHVRFNV
jgi:ribosome-binding ATPase YchF (GTP1/OBG family)